MNIEQIEKIADKLTGVAMAEIYGERYTATDDITTDDELDSMWDTLNEDFFQIIANSCANEDI